MNTTSGTNNHRADPKADPKAEHGAEHGVEHKADHWADHSADNKVLILELNEVPWKVIDSFIARHPDSTLAQISRRAGRLTTHLPDTGQLHPKTSWQSFHRGVPDYTHGIREYNQLDSEGHRNNPPLWDLAQQHGKRVGCGASIGSWPLPQDKTNIDFWFADPFAPTPDSIPASINAFQEFNTLSVARSSRQVRKGGVPRKVVSNFLINASQLGIRPGTVLKTCRQLLSERFNKARVVRRRNVQALMSFDVAEKQWRTTQPHLATVFINHVAAAMHRYWAAAYPDDYDSNNMPAAWRETYRNEIDEAMQVADGMLSRVMKSISGTNTTVLILGSMGQAGIEHEPTFNQLIIKDVKTFMSLAGMCSGDYERRPGMEPEYVLSFRTKSLLDQFIQACTSIRINGEEPEIKRASDTECSLLVDQYNVGFDSIQVRGQTIPIEASGLYIDLIEDIAGSTAQHTVDGMAMVVCPEKDLSYLNDHNEPIDVCSITAAVLGSLDVPVPDYMPAPLHDLVLALQARKTTKALARSAGAKANVKQRNAVA